MNIEKTGTDHDFIVYLEALSIYCGLTPFLIFSTSRQTAQQFSEVLIEIRQLENNQPSAALYRAQQQPGISQDFVNWLKNTLEQQERQRLN